MNFQKLLLIVIPLAILIVAWQWFTRIDRTNAVEVATAFTSALKSGNTSGAAKFYDPEGVSAWQERIDSMKSGATERLLDWLPEEPAFTAPVTSPAGVTTVASADKQYILTMKQIEGDWYVSKTP